MNIEDQNSTSQKAYEPSSNDITMNLSYLLLNFSLFNDPIYDSIKANENIASLDDLVEAFSTNKEALKKLLSKTISNKGLLLNKKKEKIIKNTTITNNLETSTNSANEKFSQNDVEINKPTDQSNSYASVAKRNLGKINFKRNKIIVMNKEDESAFLSGTLDNKKVVEKPYHHMTRYFKFPQKGRRSINQVRSYLLSLGINLRFISNISLINDDILELAYFKGYRDVIEAKITKNLVIMNNNIDLLFNRETTKEDLLDILPISSDEFVLSNELSIGRLEKLDIKLGYQKYLRILNNRIKDIVSKETMREHQEIIEIEMSVNETRPKRKLSNNDLDEFAINRNID